MLTKNQPAPEIIAETITGRSLNLYALKGKKVLIKFHRFSGCPVAQREIHELTKQQTGLNTAGIETILFLYNSREKILPAFKEAPGLHIIADRQKKFYRLYQSEFSWKKIFSLQSWLEIVKSFSKGYFPRFNRFEGGVIGIPSDFLVDENSVIRNMHYGKHVGDSMTVPEVLEKLN